MTTIDQRPDTVRIEQDNYDVLEVMDLGDHVILMQITEEGESETVVIGKAQWQALGALIGRTQ